MGKLGNISGKEAVKAFAKGWLEDDGPGRQPCGYDEAGRAGESFHPST
jgi:hypothetical protein